MSEAHPAGRLIRRLITGKRDCQQLGGTSRWLAAAAPLRRTISVKKTAALPRRYAQRLKRFVTAIKGSATPAKVRQLCSATQPERRPGLGHANTANICQLASFFRRRHKINTLGISVPDSRRRCPMCEPAHRGRSHPPARAASHSRTTTEVVCVQESR